jgi:SAM-dependent methyltransferase
LERIIKAASNQGDLVADFFCGSGTTLAVAEKLGRKWIGSDLGRFAIHTSRKRLIGVQRELKKAGKDFRPFEILNIGSYDKARLEQVNGDLREEEKQKLLLKKEKEFIEIVLSAYKAEKVESFNSFFGKKRDRLIAVGPLDSAVSSDFIDAIIGECLDKNITKVDILGFDFEMGLDIEKEKAKGMGLDIGFKIIPREVFDKRAVEKGQVRFYDVAHVEVRPILKREGNKQMVSIELTDFYVFYNQDSNGEISENMPKGGNKVVIRNGDVVKLSKDKETGIVSEEVLTKSWKDWIDYWAVDFNFESKKEIRKVIDVATGEEKAEWLGSYIFENEWQTYRTKKNRALDLVSAPREVEKGRRKIAVKVIDIFGNDTTKVIELNI